MCFPVGIKEGGYLSREAVSYTHLQIGFGSSWMNPFSVGIAQGIAGIDVFSGAGFRMVMWVVFTAPVSYTHLEPIIWVK